MPLMNAGKMARNAASITNRANAGGVKKAGLRPTSGAFYLTSKPSAMLSCAPQLNLIPPIGSSIPCFPVVVGNTTHARGYRATIGANL